MWHDGTITVQDKNGKKVEITYTAKIYDEGSMYGINEGRISKLTLKQGKETVANYDRGWDIPPKTTEAKKALEILLEKYK